MSLADGLAWEKEEYTPIPQCGPRSSIGIQGVMEEWRAQSLYHSLVWALRRVEFPLAMDEDGSMYKACPGCILIWTRDMKHDENCEYAAAVELVKKLSWIEDRAREEREKNRWSL
jgi:hypothetical protein